MRGAGSRTSLVAVAGGVAVGAIVVLAVRAGLLDEARVPELAVRRFALAVAVTALAFAWTARAPAARALRPSRRTLDLLGGLLGTLALATYWGLGNDVIRYHPWDQYHYYLGAKYFPELGYRHLYACAAVAESERVPVDEMEGRRMRDLTTDRVVAVDAVVATPDECRRRFTPPRWKAFGDDVMFFRDAIGRLWDRMQQDHGFNAPPTWVLAGGALARLGPASAELQTALAWVDWALLAVMLALIAWAFGGHVLLVAVVAWAVQVPGQASWTAGAFLRHDWLVLVVASACFARRGFPAASGAALASAALLRLFPAILVALPLVTIARRTWQGGRLRRFDRRFLIGVLAAGVAWVAVSTAVFGLDSWLAFRDHITLHRLTPLANHVGLRSIFAQSWEGRWTEVMQPGAVDPFHEWKRLRLETFAARGNAYRVVMVLLLGMAAVAGWRSRRLWVALAASSAVVPIVLDVASYYCALFILLALLAATSRAHEWVALGAVVVGRAVDALPIAAENPDIRYTVAQSSVFVAWAVAALVLVARRPAHGPPGRVRVAEGGRAARRRRVR